MNTLIKIIIAQITAAALVAMALYSDLLAHDILALSFLCLFAIASIPLAIIAGILDDQHKWLGKGHGKERATEIIIPPHTLQSLHKFLKEESPNASSLDSFITSYTQRWQLFANIAYYTAIIIALFGIIYGSLFVFDFKYIKEIIHISDKITPLLFQHAAAGVLEGIILAAGLFASGYFITKQGQENTIKIVTLLNKKRDKDSLLSWSKKPIISTSVLVIGGVLLALVPLLGVRGYYLQKESFQHKIIEETHEAKKTLEESLTETQEKIDFFATENVTLQKERNQTIKNNKMLSDEVTALKKQIRTFKKDISKLHINYDDKINQLNKTKAKTADLEKQLKLSKESVNKASVVLKNKVKELEKKLQEHDSSALEKKEHLFLLEGKLSNLNKKAASYKKKNKSLKAQLAEQKEIASKKGIQQLPQITFPDFVKTINPEKVELAADEIFISNTSSFTENGEEQLRLLANAIKKYLIADKQLSVALFVHTDALPPQGAYGSNTVLSAVQAARIRDVFTAEGIAGAQILPTGLGNSHEIDGKLTEDAMAINRRIELFFTRTVN